MSASKSLLCITICAGLATSANGQSYRDSMPYLTPIAPYDLNVSTSVGNSNGTLRWNIDGGKQGPNILSELTYQDLNFRQLTLSGALAIRHGWLAGYDLNVKFNTGIANKGTVQDSDYNGDNRTGEYSRSYSSAVDSTMQDFELGFGRNFKLSHFISLRPAAGFIRKTQNLLMTEGLQTVNTRNPGTVGPFRGTLNSSYDTTWDSFWLGLDWKIESPLHQFSVGAQLNWLDYSAVADWNLRSDLAHPKSFDHHAQGMGYSLSASYAYSLNNTLSMNISWQQKHWNTDPGQDRVYFADGSNGSTTLNEVSWKESAITTGLILRF